jgi:uncharacterized protein (TIGR02001 family)
VLSDYRYRGVSLSDNKPAAQISASYDAASGWYAGAFASTVRYAIGDERGLQAIAYGGHAWRSAGGASFEAGASYTKLTGTLGYDYPEVYVGVVADPVAARLYYAPRYAGYDSDTLYAELNGVHRLDDRVRLFAHAGALHSPVDRLYFRRPDWVADGRAGIAVDIDRVTLQLAWVGVSSTASYPFVVRGSRNRAVVAVSASF